MASAPAFGVARAPARVLLVDDSIVARAVLARAVAATPSLVVVAQAGSGRQALAVLRDIAVDLIVLDLEMPDMGGLEALPALLAAGGQARVLIVSSAAGDGAAATVTALRLGAADTLLKPKAGFGGTFTSELVERLRRLAPTAIGAVAVAAAPAAMEAGAVDPAPPPPPNRPVACLAVGASTGGVHALSDFFAAYPARLDAPILVTQHLPTPFMPHFARQLADMARRPVRVAADGMPLDDGTVLLAPGDGSIGLARTRGRLHVRLERRRSASGHLPSVDPMFAAVAEMFGREGVGVVLSGMGRDGLEGAGTLRRAGGTVLAQDAATSVVWGMPGVVAQAGLAQLVAPADALARRVEAMVPGPGAIGAGLAGAGSLATGFAGTGLAGTGGAGGGAAGYGAAGSGGAEPGLAGAWR